MQIFKNLKQKQKETDIYYFETKVEVFYKYETAKIFQFFKKVHWFVCMLIYNQCYNLSGSFIQWSHMNIISLEYSLKCMKT